jgi:predicted MFS family arabinose efflux permease
MSTYVTITVGESILAPLLPTVGPELGFSTAQGGQVLGLISVSAAVGNLAGGSMLGRTNARVTTLIGLAFSVLGSLAAATIPDDSSIVQLTFQAAHASIGFGAGFYFAGGVFSVGRLAPEGRRGRMMGRYGIAYSVALAIAAILAATIGVANWRSVFAVAAVLGTISFALVAFVDLPGSERPPRTPIAGSVRLLVPAVVAGGVAAMAQFGLTSYIPTFAVEDWAMSASAAATVLFIGRLASIPGKSLAGWMVDRYGAASSARRMGLSLVGLAAVWLLSPVALVGAAASIAFAAGTGGMFPMANVLAFERFGARGGMLGVFRSLQMAVAGISVWLVGLATNVMGLQTALLIGTATLVSILFLAPSELRPQPQPHG